MPPGFLLGGKFSYNIGLDWLIIDEAATLPNTLIWEQYLRPTLSDRNGWALFTSTPRSFNWLYELFSRGKDDNFPDWDSWQHSSMESPYFKDDIEELKRTLDEMTYKVLADNDAAILDSTNKIHTHIPLPLIIG